MSYLTLYVSKHLQKGKNFLIESFSDYLASLFKVSIDKFQYIRPLKVITIKLDLAQIQATPFPIIQYNYLDIQLAGSSDTTHYYYFITHKVQKASQTIELTCEMDVLNTFKWNSDYLVDNKTLVVREHQDRVAKRTPLMPFSFPLARIIPLRSEGINAPVYKTHDERIYQNDADINWILYYRNANAYDPSDPDAFTLDNPIECFIAPNKPIQSRYANTNTQILASSFLSGYHYLITKVTINVAGVGYSITAWQCWEIYKSGTTLTINRCYINDSGDLEITNRFQIGSGLSAVEIVDNTYASLNMYYTLSPADTFDDIIDGTPETFSLTPSTTTITINPDAIDRTDSRNIKIIELPYAPSDIEYDSVNDVYLFDGNWEYDATQKLFKLKNLETKFTSNFLSEFNPLLEKGLTRERWEELHGEDSPSSNDLREDYLEGKIYHSDYYRPKFVYDSFSLVFQLESLRAIDSGQYDFNIEFYASTNVVSKFLFMFPNYRTYYGNADFDNVVAVSRNNEQVIYNSQYLNYIRNGYNYDLKTKQRNEEVGGIGLGISIASTLLGVVGGIATQNYGMAVMSLVGGGLTIANQAVSYAKSVAQSEQNLEQKLNETKMQAVSVMNADDIDLLNAYSGNKAKWVVYEVSYTMKKALLDMFYYAGYSTNELKVPSVDTRYWFNYLQCELVLEVASNKAYLSDEIEDELKNRFKEGVTFFHYKNGTWDLDQVKENYESWILA